MPIPASQTHSEQAILNHSPMFLFVFKSPARNFSTGIPTTSVEREDELPALWICTSVKPATL
jgi:hypothetical protein